MAGQKFLLSHVRVSSGASMSIATTVNHGVHLHRQNQIAPLHCEKIKAPLSSTQDDFLVIRPSSLEQYSVDRNLKWFGPANRESQSRGPHPHCAKIHWQKPWWRCDMVARYT